MNQVRDAISVVDSDHEAALLIEPEKGKLLLRWEDWSGPDRRFSQIDLTREEALKFAAKLAAMLDGMPSGEAT